MHPEAAVEWPTEEEMETMAGIFGIKYPALAAYNIWGFSDGVKFRVEVSLDEQEQSIVTKI